MPFHPVPQLVLRFHYVFTPLVPGCVEPLTPVGEWTLREEWDDAMLADFLAEQVARPLIATQLRFVASKIRKGANLAERIEQARNGESRIGPGWSVVDGEVIGEWEHSGSIVKVTLTPVVAWEAGDAA